MSNTRRILIGACLTALTLAAAPVRAELPRLQFSAFGTLGVVATRPSDLQFYRVGLDKPGDESATFGPDSVLGIQADVALTPHNSFVLQAISRENPVGSYEPRVTLAFLSHSFTPSVTVRLGRLRIPFFMRSDSLDINYANPWIRPPVEVYGLNPVSDLDGIDFLLRTRIGEADVEIQPYAGTSKIPIYERGRGRLKRLAGVNFTVSTERLTLFLGHGEADLRLEWTDADFLRLNAVLPPAVGSMLSGKDGSAKFSSAGFEWDDGTWLLIGEYARRESHRYSNSAHGWHLTVGHRFGNVMPYLTLARQTEDSPIVDTDGLSPPVAAGLDRFLASRNLAQKSATLGMRWDFHHDAALKLELTHTRTPDDSWGSFYPRGDPSANSPRGRTINMLGLAVDVVF